MDTFLSSINRLDYIMEINVFSVRYKLYFNYYYYYMSEVMLNRANKILNHLVSIYVTGFLRNVAKQCRMPEKRGEENNDLRGSEKAYKWEFSTGTRIWPVAIELYV